MFALSDRPFRNAGLALYGLGSLASLGMMSNQASAQTLANNNQPAPGITRSDVCDRYLPKGATPKEMEAYVACELREIDRRIAETDRRIVVHQQQTAAARKEIACQEVLIGAIQKGRFNTDTVRAVYAGRPVGSINACDVLTSLAKS